MKIINLTPHPVIVVRDDPDSSATGFVGIGPAAKEIRYSVVAEIKPAGPVARARQTDDVVGNVQVNGYTVPLVTSRYGDPTDLPTPENGTFYVVSILTAQAAKAAGRDMRDLLVTSDPVRDAAGKIVGCRKFSLV
ncbi:MAG: hypothetical protein WC768_03135 [Patescibacteria group bacterium]|jgi:hypothetical protein